MSLRVPAIRQSLNGFRPSPRTTMKLCGGTSNGCNRPQPMAVILPCGGALLPRRKSLGFYGAVALAPSCGMEEVVLDESRFSQRLQLQALRVPKQISAQVSKLLTGYVIDKPRVKHRRLVILSDSVKDSSLRDIPDDKLSSVKELVNLDVVAHELLLLGYEHWNADHVLRELLPSECDVPSAFETIGHIAHLNLRDEHSPYKKLIGKVLLDKNYPKLRTIVNKVGVVLVDNTC